MANKKNKIKKIIEGEEDNHSRSITNYTVSEQFSIIKGTR